ncbi:MAG: hypothetical protein WC781_01295 [Candidatus Pacearchaeota archaeon]|jgi:hypothetical protein
MDIEIIKKNLERMLGQERYCMDFELVDESIGGNAGFYEKRPCAGANFYYNPTSGKIKAFGICQIIPKEILSRYPKGSFRVTISPYSEIVNCYLQEGASSEAQSNISESIKIYNVVKKSQVKK